MTRDDYFRRAGDLANAFGEKTDLVDRFRAGNPDLADDAVFQQYLDLEQDAHQAGHEWLKFCSDNRHKV